MNIQPLFTSFLGGVAVACPAGKVPTVMAYPDLECTGVPVSAGTLPPTGANGQCTEIAAEVSSGSVSVGGQSAEFTCA